MHGIVKPLSDEAAVRTSRWDAIRATLHEYRFMLMMVVAPTLIVAGYYYLIASDQFESEADFLVRSAEGGSARSAEGLGALLMEGVSPAREDTISVIDYLRSTEATLQVERAANLTARFTRPHIDWISRLRKAQPAPEELRKYYNSQAKVQFDKDTGIARLTVHAFTPQDAYVIAASMLRLGEQRVNELNQRSNGDAVRGATRQLAEAENELRQIQRRLTSFRRTQSNIDPEATGKAQQTALTGFNAQLITARTQLQAMRGIIAPSSPQYIAAQARVRALEAAIGRQGGEMTGAGSGALVNILGDYEELRIRQEFASKRYALAAAAYQAAREEARKKELYIIRVVNPNMPVKALFPERGRIVLTVFASLLIAYGIGWLMLAGIREHANG